MQQHVMIAPVPQIGREGEPDVGARTSRRDRPVDHRVTAAKLPWKNGGVFVLGRHDWPEADERLEIDGRGQRDQRADRRKGRVGDDPLLAIGDPGDAGVFHAPRLFRVIHRIGREGGLGIDPPVGDAVGTAGHTEVGMAATVFDPHEQQRGGADLAGARIEDGVDRVGPVIGREDRITLVAAEQFGVMLRLHKRRHATLCSGDDRDAGDDRDGSDSASRFSR